MQRIVERAEGRRRDGNRGRRGNRRREGNRGRRGNIGPQGGQRAEERTEGCRWDKRAVEGGKGHRGDRAP
jgi:hypothetical protein